MRYRLVETGRSYAEAEESGTVTGPNISVDSLTETVLPVIWETGNVPQINSLLALREAELLLAKSQLTGKPNIDWFINNRIRDLEIKISDMKRWRKEAQGGNGQ